jgi:hypothetical protein
MSRDPKEFAERMKARMDDKGFTFLKMDLGVGLGPTTPASCRRPLGMTPYEERDDEHMFTGMELTPKGVELMADYVAQVREVIGMEVPLAADHFGHIGVNSCIRLGKALEPYNMAWLEDMIPWQHTEQMKQITDAVDMPILTGEDIYLKELHQTGADARGGYRSSRTWPLRAGCSKPRRSATPAGVRRADGDALRRHAGVASWPTFTARRRRRTSLRWSIIRWMCRGGRT